MPRAESQNDHRELIAARLPDDLHQQFESYRDGRGIDTTTAVRRLLRTGLDAEQGTQDRQPILGAALALSTVYIGIHALGASSEQLMSILAGTTLIVVTVWAAAPTLRSLRSNRP